MQTYLVGGAVRDELLGLEPVELDWVIVGAHPAELEAAGYRRVGKDFPVFLHPQTGEEYALARTERKSGHGYHGFDIHAGPEVTLEADLGRRDLTVNAMARAPTGELIDPCGGAADLDARVLRHISPAFAEDPLRVLRVARFAARLAPMGFTIADETLALMRSMRDDGELDWLVADRVWQETARALAEPVPGRYFEVLVACDALAAILPELAPLFTTDAEPGPMTALAHAAQADVEPHVRFAALVHPLDVDAGLAELGARLPVPRRWQALARAVACCQQDCRRIDTDSPNQAWSILQCLDALRRPERLADVLAACAAIAATHAEAGWPARAELLQQAHAAAAAIGGAALASEGWRGAALGREQERRRTEAIQQCFARISSEHP